MERILTFNDEEAEEMLGDAWKAQTLGECVKWLSELQIYQGSKDCVDVHNGDNACGGYYVAEINRVLADMIIEKTGAVMKKLCAVGEVKK